MRKIRKANEPASFAEYKQHNPTHQYKDLMMRLSAKIFGKNVQKNNIIYVLIAAKKFQEQMWIP